MQVHSSLYPVCYWMREDIVFKKNCKYNIFWYVLSKTLVITIDFIQSFVSEIVQFNIKHHEKNKYLIRERCVWAGGGGEDSKGSIATPFTLSIHYNSTNVMK